MLRDSPQQFPFVSDFAVFRLSSLLTKLGCTGSAANGAIAWYWKAAKTWPAASQTDFDEVAAANIKNHLIAPDAADTEAAAVADISRAIKAGTKKSIPAKLRSRKFVGTDQLTKRPIYHETQIPNDASQDAWVKLLESGQLEGKAANIAGRSAGRDLMRKVLKEEPISQSTLPNADPDDSRPADQRDPLLPWDRVRPEFMSQFHPGVLEMLRNNQDQVRRRLFADFEKARPEDCAFIVDYVSRTMPEPRFRNGGLVFVKKRGTKLTEAEHRRARRILEELRKQEAAILKV